VFISSFKLIINKDTSWPVFTFRPPIYGKVSSKHILGSAKSLSMIFATPPSIKVFYLLCFCIILNWLYRFTTLIFGRFLTVRIALWILFMVYLIFVFVFLMNLILWVIYALVFYIFYKVKSIEYYLYFFRIGFDCF